VKRPWIAIVLSTGLGAVAPVATLATTTMSAGCMCGLAGGIGGARMTLDNVPVGQYRVEVEAWDEVVSIETTYDGACQGIREASGVRLRVEVCGTGALGRRDGIPLHVSDLGQIDGPRQLTLRVFRDGVLVHTAMPRLSYDEFHPNGASCGGEVQTADATIALP
jgi:hypothetical protein